MDLDLSPLAESIDCRRLDECHVTFVGCGGSHHLATGLVRSGVRRLQLIDADIVTLENLCRADFFPVDIGRPKSIALGQTLSQLGATVERHVAWIEDVPDSAFSRTSLLIAATDSFAAQAAVNQIALRQKRAALFCGLSRQGLGGEVIFWYPGLPCFRCLVSKRYQWHDDRSLADMTPSHGATGFDLAYLHAIAGQIALGLLLRGTSTRFGRLLDTLGDRNFLRLKIDPYYRQAGRDWVQAELGIPVNNNYFTGWCVSAQADPGRGQPPCPDCLAFGHGG